MNYEIDYSVIIRTIGKAGEKYEQLLESINNLIPKPKEVIVVLPEGFEKPKEQLGWETFYFSPKGMVAQRSYGIKMAKTKYALICDDDISFDSDFVQKLYRPIFENKCSISAGPLLELLPEKGMKTLINIIMSSASPTLLHKDKYVTVLRSTGFSFNRNIKTDECKFYYTESLPWACFFADVDSLNILNIDEENWLDANGYSAYDDQTMFYKGYLRGVKSLVVSNALYTHLDAGTSTKNIKSTVAYSLIFNRYVFWHRFIYTQQKSLFLKAWSKVCFRYRMLWTYLWDLFEACRGRKTFSDFTLTKTAYKNAKAYIKSNAYKELPPV